MGAARLAEGEGLTAKACLGLQARSIRSVPLFYLILVYFISAILQQAQFVESPWGPLEVEA